MSLIEVMISGTIGTMVVLAVSQSFGYAVKAFRSIENREKASAFTNEIKMAAMSRQSCASIISAMTGTLDPASTSATPVKLILPSGTYSNGSPIGSGGDYAVKNISFTKTMDTNSGGPFTTAPNQYWPITGTITVKIDNLAAQQKRTFGARDLQVSVPLSLTFKRTGGTGTWSIDSCESKAPTLTTNSGWNQNNLNDPNLCQTYTVTSTTGGTAACPAGTYLVKSTQTNVPYNYDAYSADCRCAGSCKGCHCVTGSACSNTCSASGVSTVTQRSCMGTCDTHDNCIKYTATGLTTTLTTTCCKVQR